MAGGRFGGGAGTPHSPLLVEDAVDLYQIRSNVTAYYKLVDNINLGVAPYNTGKGWLPIAGFSGNLNGNGKKIYNLFINRPDEDDVGLFKQLKAASLSDMQKVTITDLCLENVDITGRSNVGALFGSYNVNVASNAAEDFYAVLTQCSVQGRIQGNKCVGGLGGQYKWESTSSQFVVHVASSCLADVIIMPGSGGGSYGQILGLISDGSLGKNKFHIKNCIGKCRIDTSLQANPAETGAMCYHKQGENLIAGTCYYDKTLWPGSTVDTYTNHAQALATAEMINSGTFSLLSELKIGNIPLWYFPAGAYPQLYCQSPDYLFVFGDGGYYTYDPETSGWIQQYAAPPDRQEAMATGMRHLDYIPQAAWDYFKNHNQPYIVNIIDKANSFKVFAIPFRFTKDEVRSNDSQTVFRKQVAFLSSDGHLSAIYI